MTKVSGEVYRRALREISHNRYVVLECTGRIVDTKVLMDGDIVLSDAEEERDDD